MPARRLLTRISTLVRRFAVSWSPPRSGAVCDVETAMSKGVVSARVRARVRGSTKLLAGAGSAVMLFIKRLGIASACETCGTAYKSQFAPSGCRLPKLRHCFLFDAQLSLAYIFATRLCWCRAYHDCIAPPGPALSGTGGSTFWALIPGSFSRALTAAYTSTPPLS